MTSTQLFFKKLQTAYDLSKPFVAYRNPNERKVNLMIQSNSELNYLDDYSEKGFVFAPFDSKEKTILLTPDEKDELLLLDSFFQEKEVESCAVPEDINSKQNHIELVSSAIDFLKKEVISKVVVARAKKIESAIQFIEIFSTLLRKYSAAYVYVWYHPKVGMWVGASPETLIKVDEESFKTMSLAGTQKYINTTDVSWGNKELEEQQMVTDYVLSNLKNVTSSLSFSEVKTIKAGSLLHLKTDIYGELAKGASLEKIIHTLHPTPAVCGFPKKKAQDFIFENEKFNRKYYTGFLGELNLNNKTNLFVNLRCMEILDKKTASIYIGGGITAKSNPEKEWEETVAKAKTMEASFGSYSL